MPTSRFRSRCLLASLACLVSACGIDGRAVGSAGSSAVDTAGRGGSEATANAGASGADGALGGASGAGPDGAGGSNIGAVAGSTGLGGAGGSGGSGEAGTSGSTGSPDGGVEPEPELPSCASRALEGLGTVTATTTNAPGNVALSCGAGTSDDVSVFWVAPAAGYYSIDTFGSSFDTTLGVLSASCDGTELACADDSSAPPSSELVREFAAGEAVVLVVDGKSGSFGEVSLSTHAVTCPGIDLNQQVPPLASTTLDGTNEHGGACGGDGRREKAFRWTAPSAGLYRFTANSDEMTPALYLERGARCGGALLGCNTGAFQSAATVVRQLGEGEVVTLIVEGTDGDGAFSLDVEDISENECPGSGTIELFGEDVTAELGQSDPSVLTGSCAPARQSVLPGGQFDLPEHSYALSIDRASCRVEIISDGDLAVYVLDGNTCGGAELSCENVPASPEGALLDGSLGNLIDGPIDYIITVESTNPVNGDVTYTLGFRCAVI